MGPLKSFAALALAYFLLPAALRAETPEGRTEVSILIGVSLLNVKAESPGPYFTPPVPVPVPDPGPMPVPPYGYQRRDSLGGSFLQGFKVGRYVSDRAVVELAFAVAPTHHFRSESFFSCPPDVPCPLAARGGAAISLDRQTLAAYHYGLGLGYDLARGDVKPFLSFGVGGVSYDTTDRVETQFAFNFGAGAKLYFGKVGARIEVGDEVVTNHFLTGRTEHDLQVRAGLVFRLP